MTKKIKHKQKKKKPGFGSLFDQMRDLSDMSKGKKVKKKW